MSAEEPKVKTCLWFNGCAEEAVKLYTSLIPDSKVLFAHKGPNGSVTITEFLLAGTPYQALNYPTEAKFTTACSIQVMTKDQEETDRLWGSLTADGGAEGMCGWLTDRFGLSWQIVPTALPKYVGGSDAEGAARAMSAMHQMKKIEIARLESAYNGESS
mmetsp:Transcript_32709/g.77071  ORF Transcript_32709/g.77071 Transcript_32709/m.77071 type:complete len:159 (+) Transcript_32709:182-658(+)|eukprot:3260260-Rhodomonas_salina.2